MDNGLWDNPRGDNSQADVQFTRMLHAETQRQLAKVTHTLTELDNRLREMENLKNYREGQMALSGSMGAVTLKIGLVILAFVLGIWGSNLVAPPCERQRDPAPNLEIYDPQANRPRGEPYDE